MKARLAFVLLLVASSAFGQLLLEVPQDGIYQSIPGTAFLNGNPCATPAARLGVDYVTRRFLFVYDKNANNVFTDDEIDEYRATYYRDGIMVKEQHTGMHFAFAFNPESMVYRLVIIQGETNLVIDFKYMGRP